jgi:hypothetical protein
MKKTQRRGDNALLTTMPKFGFQRHISAKKSFTGVPLAPFDSLRSILLFIIAFPDQKTFIQKIGWAAARSLPTTVTSLPLIIRGRRFESSPLIIQNHFQLQWRRNCQQSQAPFF